MLGRYLVLYGVLIVLSALLPGCTGVMPSCLLQCEIVKGAEWTPQQ